MSKNRWRQRQEDFAVFDGEELFDEGGNKFEELYKKDEPHLSWEEYIIRIGIN